jgi:two-component system NtrC family sensor kinase
MLFIGTVLVANLLVSSITLLSVSRVLLDEVKVHLRMNLVAAEGIFDSYRRQIADALHLAALDNTLTAPARTRDTRALGAHLEAIRRETDLDLLWWVAPDGRISYRAGNPTAMGDDVTGVPIIAKALASGLPLSGTLLLPRNVLQLDRVAAPPAGAAAPPSACPQECLALAAAVPVVPRDGGAAAVMFGARLLNQHSDAVDRIRDEVFPSLDGESGEARAGVTLFEGPVRIATTIAAANGGRALGTEMSPEVCASVLDRGQPWSDRALVVDRWFLTAYAPLRDPDGRVIGALGVGRPEGPLFRPQKVIITVFASVMVLATVGSLLLLFLVTQSVLLPLTGITDMLTKVAAGDLTARVRTRSSGEMGALVDSVNDMADALEQRQAQLGAALRRQLGRSEKLASIGRLAAGVAHEVNNPLTGVLTFASLLKRKPGLDDQDRADLDLILRETTRVREIVKGLLEFARETPSAKAPLDLNEVVRRTLALLKNQKEFYKINVVENMATTLPKIDGDKNQIQQVLLNLCLNACEAMPNGGSLTITTAAHDGQVLVSFADTGTGIKSEHMDRIFEPFFTTKPVGKGTGLGLSVSYGIIHVHGGVIDVESAEGKGATFTVTFPALPVEA